MIDIDEIETLAKAATPGPWQSSQYDDLEDSNGHDLLTSSGGVSCFNRAGDADFVAAANPATILALIAEVRALREDAERYRWFQEWFMRGGKLSEIDPLGHIRFTTPEIINGNIDAARGAK